MDGGYSRVPSLSPLSLPPLSSGPGTGRPTGGHMGPPLRRTWKQFLLFRRGRTLAGPHTRRAEVVAPYTKKRSIIAPSSAPVCALGHLPPRGKACRRLIAAPTADIEAAPFSRRGRSRTGPTAYLPGALVRQTQAQMRNRTSGNFCKPRARWPGGNSDTHSDFRAPKIFFLVQGVTPVNGVRGKANMSAKRSS